VQSRFTRRALVKGGLLLSAVVPALGLLGNSGAATAELSSSRLVQGLAKKP